MSRNDPEYYRMRAATEHALAESSTLPKVAAIHEQMASRYDSLSEATEVQQPPSPDHC
jgi:hypothetical protein